MLSNEKVKGLRIEFHQSEGDSRDNDNLTAMVCFHKGYDLGDKEHGYNQSDYDSFEELKDAILKNETVLLIKPLYLYDHSGITIATSPFNCRFDSGQIGWVFVTQERVDVLGAPLDSLDRQLEVEVKTYDEQIRGEVYGFICYKDNEEVDSCGGFHGSNPNTNGMYEYIPEEFEGLLESCDDLTEHL